MPDLSYLGIIPPYIQGIAGGLTPPHPAGVTLRALNLLYWRVRTWSLTATINASRSGPGVPATPDSAVGLISGEVFGHLGPVPVDELGLVLNDWYGFGYGLFVQYPNGNSYVYNDASTFPMNDIGIELGTYFDDLETAAQAVEGQFYFFTPPFAGASIGGVSALRHEPILFTNGNDPATFKGTSNGTGSFTLGPDTVSYDWDMELVPASWWSFGGRFDTSTGLPL